jgi:hypothetical protein
VRFRSFEDDLISASTWQEQDRLVQQTGQPRLTHPIHEHLAALEQQLEAQLVAVNQRIVNRENQHIRAWIRRLSLLGLERGVATIMAPNASAKAALEDRYLGMLRDLLSMFAGEPLEVRVILNPSALAEAHGVPAANAPAQAEADAPTTDGCPAWIAAERWVALPAMLRAALAGSELIDGVVRGRSPHLGRVLRLRFAREVDELIVEACAPD